MSETKEYVPAIKITERQFMRAVTDLAGYLGWRSYHEVTSFGSKPGKPDLELSHEQHGLLFLELKVGNRQPTEAQRDWLDWYRQCRIPAYLVRPSDMEFLERLLKGESA